MCFLRGLAIVLLLVIQYGISHYHYRLNAYRVYYTYYARCGSQQCQQAVEQAMKEREQCRQKYWLGLCRQNINWLDRRFPRAMETETELLQDLCNSEASQPRVIYYRWNRKKRFVRCGTELYTGKMFVWSVNTEETCCATAKKMTHFTSAIRYGNNSEYLAWPVYCPLTRRYQWTDYVRCINSGCETSCTISHTYRQYLVTNVRPHYIYGHCFVFWIPVWFMRLKVSTHCTCLVYD